jgi:dihydrofolate synthase/folylpolyglutamate synthase
VIVDGSHNVEGVEGLAATLDEEFPSELWQIVAGMRGDRSPGELLAPLAGLADRLWATAPDDSGAISPAVVAESGAAALGCDASVVDGVPEAVAAAIEAAGPDGAVVVTGSLYVAGEARGALIGTQVRPSGVHMRYEAELAHDIDEEWTDSDDEWSDTGDAWAETNDDG